MRVVCYKTDTDEYRICLATEDNVIEVGKNKVLELAKQEAIRELSSLLMPIQTAKVSE